MHTINIAYYTLEISSMHIINITYYTLENTIRIILGYTIIIPLLYYS